MAKILSFDTHSESCSVCLLNTDPNSPRYALRSALASRSHAQHILPMVDEVLVEANLTLRDLDGIAFGRGPGSFTGLRIAAGVAQGLAYGSDLPVFPVSNLQALAYMTFSAQPKQEYCLSLIDARMDEVYWAVFQNTQQDFGEVSALVPHRLVDEQVGSPESVSVSDSLLSSCMAVGTGLVHESRISNIARFNVLADVEHTMDSAQAVAELALLDFLASKGVKAAEAAPVYIRDNVTWKKLPGR
jgi:tRNA threonylcarbamoyladenosine biosynthesis protein TsaB